MFSGAVPSTVVAISMIAISQAQALTVVSSVEGRMSPRQETCMQGLTTSVGDGENCMYDGGPSGVATATPYGEITGSYEHISYYDSVDTPAAFQTTVVGSGRVVYAPSVGDGKIEQVISGSVTIDDGGNGFGADDLISFNITLTSPGTGSIVRVYSGSAGVDKYDSMTQVLAPIAANFATPNGSGGFDYIIGSEGFPTVLTYSETGPCLDAAFGYAECGHSFSFESLDPDFWNGTSLAGIGSLESNFGAKTTGTVANLQCIDGSSTTSGVESNDCRDSQVLYSPWVLGPCAVQGGCTLKEGDVGAVRGSAEDVGWDQLLLKVSTDAAGNVLDVAGFNVDDYRVFNNTRCGDNTAGTGSYNPTCNSWTSGYFTLARSSATANDDGPLNADEGVPLPVSVMANDTGFQDPVTVTVTTPPTQGIAVVSGSPGPQAGIVITYTANSGATGGDSFEYTVVDANGTTTDSATVSLAIGSGARNDTATTRRNTPVDINVGANDVGFGPSVTVTIDDGSFSHGGSATVTAGNSGPADDVVVTYVPASANNTPTYTETFLYTIDDGVLGPFTAQVTVTVQNKVPTANAAGFGVTTQGRAPVDAEHVELGTFTVPPTRLGDTPPDLSEATPDLVTIAAQGTRGEASVSFNDALLTYVITYKVTDPTFYTGTDSFTYLITDVDGDTASAVLTVTIADVEPNPADLYQVVGQGRASSALAVIPNEVVAPFDLDKLKLGNGSPEEHTLAVTAQGTNGVCQVSPANGSGKLVYTPNDRDFTGNDTCTLQLTDANGDSAVIAVQIKVTELPQQGGASSSGPWNLLLLSALLLRRLSRRTKAKLLARRAGSIAALAALLASGMSASAQEAEKKGAQQESSAGLQEIVVTARRMEEKLLEVPVAITAFDSKAIEALGITSLTDVAALTPGLSFFNAFGENLPVPVIRGIVPTDIFGQNNAAIFVDGVYISGREGLNFSQLDIERIEVVKGPQSALYGRNAFSGAINYVTKPPSEEFEAKTGVEIGNRGKVKGQASVSGPILGENLRGRVAALYDDWDGSYDNPEAPQNDIGGSRFRSFQGALLWLPTDALRVNVSYYHSNDDIDESANVALPTNCEDRTNDLTETVRYQNFCGEVPDIEGIPGLNNGDAIPKVAEATGENRELNRANLKIEWDLYEYGMFSALTGYSNTEQDSVSDFARSLGNSQYFLYCDGAAYTPGVPNNCPDNNPADQRFQSGVYDRELGGETEEISQELRFSSPQDKALRYTFGGYGYSVTSKGYPGAILLTNPIDGVATPIPGQPGVGVGLPPFGTTEGEPTALMIGTAIFHDSFTSDGGIDPLSRQTSQGETQGWALFSGVDFDFTDQLTGRAELRYSQESQESTVYRYNRCYTTATTTGSLGPCIYPVEDLAIFGDDKYDLRDGQTSALPFFGADCVFVPVNEPDREVLGSPGQCSGSASARFDSVTGRVGLDYMITDDWMVYGSIAYGEKPGGVAVRSARLVTGENVTVPNVFEPETITAYELGLKGTAWDGRATISSAVFYNDWKEIVLRQLIEVDPISGVQFEQPTSFNVNAGDADVWGVEVETNVGFTDNLTGRFTVGWADAEMKNAAQDTYNDFPSFAAEGFDELAGDVSGNQLLRQPEWLMSASLGYSDALTGEWDWYVSGDANYQSGVYVGNDNQGYLPEHTYVNTKLGVRSGVYTVEFWTRNLFDDGGAIAAFRDIYWANTDNVSDPIVPQGDRPDFDDFVPLRYTVTYPRERTFGVTAQMRFGAAAVR